MPQGTESRIKLQDLIGHCPLLYSAKDNGARGGPGLAWAVADSRPVPVPPMFHDVTLRATSVKPTRRFRVKGTQVPAAIRLGWSSHLFSRFGNAGENREANFLYVLSIRHL